MRAKSGLTGSASRLGSLRPGARGSRIAAVSRAHGPSLIQLLIRKCGLLPNARCGQAEVPCARKHVPRTPNVGPQARPATVSEVYP